MKQTAKVASLGLLVLLSSVMLSGCTRTVHQEFELSVETLILSKLYGSPPTVAATLTGWSGVCERIETRQRLEAQTFMLSVVGVYDAIEGEACPTIAREYSQGVMLELAGLDAGEYTVTAGDKIASFTLPAD